MINIGIISVKSNKSILKLIEAANRHPKIDKIELLLPQNITVKIDDNIKITCGKFNLHDFDILLPRGLNQENTPPYYFEILNFLQNEFGLLVINPVDVLRRANSKFQTAAILEQENIPTPKTIVTQYMEDIIDFAHQFNEVVAKPLYRSKGIDLLRFGADSIPKEKLNLLLEKYNVLLIQEFIENEGFDIRTFVLGDKVIGTYARQAPKDSWITNVSNGGKAISYELNAELEKISLQTAKVLGLQYGGLDLFETPNGYTVIEANGSPDLKDILQVENVDLAGQLIDYAINSLL